MIIKYLDWDSSFFNKKIGLLDLSNDCKFSEIQNDYDLIYVASKEEIAVVIPNYKQTFVETKVIFSKCISKSEKPPNEFVLSAFDTNISMEQIYELAFESGQFSRFKLDPNFRRAEFEKLYKKWVDNSYTKEFADDVLVYKDQNRILGFVTYKVWDGYATIGLIAVCPKHQGKGIGRKLIQSVENKLANNGVVELRIPTQLQNEMACLFYAKMGYEIIEGKILKHFWKL